MLPPLLQTRLTIPRPRPPFIPRLHLRQKLTAAAAGKLTLISAPPGYGKTSLAADFVLGLGPDTPHIAWLSLTEQDDEPVRFWQYLMAAIQTRLPQVGAAALPLLSLQPPPLETVITLLSNDLLPLADGSLILVLDDYHLITHPAIHDALNFWLDYLPPGLHLILTTRTDPPLGLPRRRARGELTELRPPDLRFTEPEMIAFLHQLVARPLPTSLLTSLAHRTEGWVAGLKLAGLTLQQQVEPLTVGPPMTGDHPYLLEYFTEELLQQQTAAQRQFLSQTAILKRLSAPICQAVTGQVDSATRLRQLVQANFFLTPLDERQEWFSYHALFREALLAQLSPEQQPELHDRAARWYAEAGLVDEAIGHWLLAGEATNAAALVEAQARVYLDRGEFFLVRGWLDQLPPAVKQQRPRLILLVAIILGGTGQIAAAADWLQTHETTLASATLPPDWQGELAQLRASLARFRGDVIGCIEAARQALALFAPEHINGRAAAYLNLLLAYVQQGALADVAETLTRLAGLGTTHHLLEARQGVAWLQIRQGDLAAAAQTYQQMIQQAEQQQPSPFVALGLAQVGWGEILYEQNDLPAAIEQLHQGMAHLQNSIEQIVLATAAGTLAQALQAQGDGAAALTVLAQADDWLKRLRLQDLGCTALVAAYRALIHLRQGNRDAAWQWVAAYEGNAAMRLTFLRELQFLVLARIYLALGQPELAIPFLERLYEEATARRWTGLLVKVDCLQALAWRAVGDEAAALTCLRRSLESGAAYSRTFLDEGEPMLALLQWAERQPSLPPGLTRLLSLMRPPAPRPRYSGEILTRLALPDPLSEREIELLQLVATGATNQQIAARLFIALPTVKKHISNILVKLDVNNRTEAVRRGRELGLLT